MAFSSVKEGPHSISAVELIGSGGYDKLRIKKYPYREPNADEVVVRIKFAGLNFADLMRR